MVRWVIKSHEISINRKELYKRHKGGETGNKEETENEGELTLLLHI